MEKISFCTAIKNRLLHLKETLPQNLKDAQGKAEFVILDYTSEDGLDSWIKPYLDNKVNYYQSNIQKYWRNSHAKNVSVLCAKNTIVCNLDADNFIMPGFVDYILDNFQEGVLTAPRALAGLTGRIVCSKQTFVSLGGYDERYSFGWGCEDIDFIDRASQLGNKISYIPNDYLKQIKHDNIMRGEFSEITDIAISNAKGLAMMAESLKNNIYRANFGKVWGSCKLIKNFQENVTVGINPIKFL